jgi:hypothetical protein
MNFLSRLTIFTGSFLLFGVQPMVGRTLLPVFGGTAAVWTTCLATFQILLLAGYGYAYWIGRDKPQSQHKLKIAHLCLLACSVVLVGASILTRPFLADWFDTQGIPVVSVVLCVLLLAGIPYMLLSSNATLIQAWISQGGGRQTEQGQMSEVGDQKSEDNQVLRHPQATLESSDVYHLYAFSNAGSLVGLLCYPLFVEPYVTLTIQWHGFAVCLALYTGLLAVLASKLGGEKCANSGIRESANKEMTEVIRAFAHSRTHAFLWLLLPATSTFLLNAVTAHLSNDITPLPLLWVILLSLFLLSYIIGFTQTGLRLLSKLPWLLIPSVLWAAWQWGLPTSGKGFIFHVIVGLLLVLLGGTMLHAWLYRIRPKGGLLTRYYLFIALGGAVGGTLSGIVSPLVFNTIAEYPIAIILVGLATLWVVSGRVKEIQCNPLETTPVAVIASVLLLILVIQSNNIEGKTLFRMRNFYGSGRISTKTYEVEGVRGQNFQANVFEHSGTVHGFQALGLLREEPTLCFTRHAGGLAITQHPLYGTTNNMRVAVAGTGIGTLAAYGREGDTYRFYEVNPQVARVATNKSLFTFISDCRADVNIVVDDARRALEEERAKNEPKWDVLIIDVYSGDAIPQHMSTKEAFQLYLDRLAPDGILAIHLTNWHLNLSPMVKAAAKEFDLHLQGFGCWADKYSMGTYWTFLTRKPLDLYIEGKHGRVDYREVKGIPLMTDEKHSLLPYLSMDPMPNFDGRNETDKIIRPVR